jgi:hypothetical protein
MCFDMILVRYVNLSLLLHSNQRTKSSLKRHCPRPTNQIDDEFKQQRPLEITQSFGGDVYAVQSTPAKNAPSTVV